MAKDTHDVTDRLVFARVGWCDFYNGTLDDEPLAGGTYNDKKIGSEWNNFSVIKGRVFGFVKNGVKTSVTRMNLRRVVGTLNEFQNDIAVAFIAKNPNTGGQYLVGWQRHVHLNDPIDYRERPAGYYGYYLWSAAATEAILLPLSARSLRIPKTEGGTGQSQVTYARDNQGRITKASWFAAVRKFILDYDGPSLTGVTSSAPSKSLAAEDAEEALRGQRVVTNAMLRNLIEKHAMRRVRLLLKKKYKKEPIDTSASESFDFLCNPKGESIKVEVKGTRSSGESLLFSANEVALARDESVDLYVVSGVRITGDAKKGFKASGGAVEYVTDWGRSKYDATPLAFQITRR